jgi:glycosyltransferase involved in cell wall biosynthesis
LRIAFWNSDPPYDPSAGGIASYIQHRACVLGRLGFEIWWANAMAVAKWSVEQQDWIERRVFKVSRLKQSLFGRWPVLSPAWECLAVEKSVDIFEFLAGINSWLSFRAGGPRIVLNCHSSIFTRAFLNHDHAVERHTARFKSWACRNLRRADGILACGNEIAMLEAGYFHLHPDRISIVPHVFSRSAEPGLSVRNEAGGNGSFLMVGNMEFLKGLDLVALGFSEYLRKGGVGRLQIAGGAGLHELRRESSVPRFKLVIEKFISDYGPEKIQFLGKLDKGELARRRAAATAVICGSRFEALTMVAGEAFLSGCPLILSERTGWHALAGRYRAARLINPYDPKDVAAAFRDMADPAKRKEYQRGGDALADYLISEDLALKTADFYRGICPRPKSAL